MSQPHLTHKAYLCVGSGGQITQLYLLSQSIDTHGLILLQVKAAE